MASASSIISSNWDATVAAKGTIADENEGYEVLSYGVILQSARFARGPGGLRYQQLDHNAGDWYMLKIFGQDDGTNSPETLISNQVNALIKIVDKFEGDATYDKIEAADFEDMEEEEIAKGHKYAILLMLFSKSTEQAYPS